MDDELTSGANPTDVGPPGSDVSAAYEQLRASANNRERNCG
jgi:hypothetical protein